MSISRQRNRVKRHKKIRHAISGTTKRPRLSVHKSLKHLRLQLIDDTKHKTLVSSTSVGSKPPTVTEASKLGEDFAKKINELGVKEIVFDRGGYRYHGKVKAIAEAIRNNGINV
ncbi:MAG: 50S ribosomal protein L18 [Patescibacteria group bacterium]|nr:50S ribosomal protein L18 [Patescibacteria group bacterium]